MTSEYQYGGENTEAKYELCYYDKSKYTPSFQTKVTGLSTENFANSASFPGWDFENTWIIKDGYPELRIFMKD